MKYLFLILIPIFTHSQKISYTYKNLNSVLKYDLLFNPKEKISEWKLRVNAKGDSVKQNPTKNRFFTTEKAIYSEEKMLTKKKFVKDEEIIKWELVAGEVTQLNYKCSIAKTSFRGRNYTAYYTNQIKENIGPWKFRGLGAAILLVKSDDNKYVFEASSISDNKPNHIRSDFEKFESTNTFLSWPDYVEAYLIDLEEHLKSLVCHCPDDGKTLLNITKIEKIHPKLHDEGIVY